MCFTGTTHFFFLSYFNLQVRSALCWPRRLRVSSECEAIDDDTTHLCVCMRACVCVCERVCDRESESMCVVYITASCLLVLMAIESLNLL